MNEIGKYDATLYNSMNDLDRAAALLAQHGDAVQALGEVVVRHGLESSLGVSLLHRHYTIAEDEWVIQRITRYGNISRPEHNRAETLPACLWKYAKEDSNYHPLEFAVASPDDSASRCESQLATAPDFRVEFADQLEKLGLADVLGLISISSTGVGTDEIAHEETNELTRESLRRPTGEKCEGVETAWSFASSEQGIVRRALLTCPACQ